MYETKNELPEAVRPQAVDLAENGDASFKEIAELISRSLGFGGRMQGLSVDDVIRQYGEAARYGAASNSRVSAFNAR
jgi:hypothetical protein